MFHLFFIFLPLNPWIFPLFRFFLFFLLFPFPSSPFSSQHVATISRSLSDSSFASPRLFHNFPIFFTFLLLPLHLVSSTSFSLSFFSLSSGVDIISCSLSSFAFPRLFHIFPSPLSLLNFLSLFFTPSLSPSSAVATVSRSLSYSCAVSSNFSSVKRFWRWCLVYQDRMSFLTSHEARTMALWIMISTSFRSKPLDHRAAPSRSPLSSARATLVRPSSLHFNSVKIFLSSPSSSTRNTLFPSLTFPPLPLDTFPLFPQTLLHGFLSFTSLQCP